jgi:hypothetical protein
MIFAFGRVLAEVKWSKSLLWSSSEAVHDSRTHFLSIGLIQRAEDKAVSIIILPLSVTVGIVTVRKAQIV